MELVADGRTPNCPVNSLSQSQLYSKLSNSMAMAMSMSTFFLTARTPPFHFLSLPKSFTLLSIKATQMEGGVMKEGEEVKKIFVAGATGNTGKRIVEQLLARGYSVKAGVRDPDKAKTTFPANPALQLVKVDVTEGSDKLAEAISDDSDAVICATGFRRSWDPLAPWKVDYYGTVNLVEACQKKGVNRFIHITSLLVNGAAMGQFLNPAYVFLNIFGLVLIAKLQAENYIRKSGINYTIIRPGGLKNDPPSGNIVMKPEDTLSGGSISRDQVAEVAVEALIHTEASFKVVEIVASPDSPQKTIQDLFAAIKQH